MGIEQFGDNERAIGQHEDARKDGYHFNNLFDQNEDGSGEKINIDIGKAIRNDVDTLPQNIKRVSEKDLVEDDPIVKELENDIATQYFLSHGLDRFGNPLPEENKPKKAA